MACQCGCSTTVPHEAVTTIAREEADASTGCACGCSSPPPVDQDRELERVVVELERRVQRLEAAS